MEGLTTSHKAMSKTTKFLLTSFQLEEIQTSYLNTGLQTQVCRHACVVGVYVS